MIDGQLIPNHIRGALNRVARDLRTEFHGRFGAETIEELALDSYISLAAKATVDRWLVVGCEKFTRQRLRALLASETRSSDHPPAVLFLCVHNAGRSQMALGFFNHLTRGRAVAWSGGSEPASEINPAAVQAMAEIGIDIAQEFPKPWTNEFMEAADVVITMGCGDSCPLVPGKRYEDWELNDPAGKSVEEVRLIRDAIGERVTQLLRELGVPVE